MPLTLPVFDLDDAVESIKNAGCVLLTGPGLLRYRGVSVQRYLREQLLELAKPGDIELYYEKESLFLFSGTSARIRVKKKAKERLRNLWLPTPISMRKTPKRCAFWPNSPYISL